MILLAKIALGTCGVAVAGAGMLCSEGMVNVKVVEKRPEGLHLHVIAPAMLAPIAVGLAPQDRMAYAGRKIHLYMPEIRAAIEGLNASEHVVLVEVREPGQHVEVAKRDGSIVVDVDDAGETVHVSAPLRAIASTVDGLDQAGSHSF
ncbi:MAG TPA: hypothetical protein VMD78_11165 [Candidatus Baltobacteraceae bacterium]|nr:hypothetical protein [Candidatus Baltobacteraceae bacterium]